MLPIPCNLSDILVLFSLSTLHFLQISDSNGAGPMAISVFHEGSDGLKLDYVEVGTDSRIVHCPIGVKLDNGEFYSTKCS